MPNLNKVILAGNLTRDPELRYTQSGQAVTDLGLAINRYSLVDGQKKEEVNFFNVTAWGKQAEACSSYLSKGSPVLIEGRLQQDTWEKDGQKRSAVKIIAERVEFLGSAKEREGRYAEPERTAPVQEKPEETDDEVPF